MGGKYGTHQRGSSAAAPTATVRDQTGDKQQSLPHTLTTSPPPTESIQGVKKRHTATSDGQNAAMPLSLRVHCRRARTHRRLGGRDSRFSPRQGIPPPPPYRTARYTPSPPHPPYRTPYSSHSPPRRHPPLPPPPPAEAIPAASAKTAAAAPSDGVGQWRGSLKRL